MNKSKIVFGGVRTHASEETTTSRWRLGPLGHEHYTQNSLFPASSKEMVSLSKERSLKVVVIVRRVRL